MRQADVSRTSPPRPSAPLEGAIIALRGQRPGEAEQLAAGVLKADRSNLVAAQVLGEALLLQNRPAEAVAVLKAPARRSEDPATETLLAMALAASGRDAEARAQLRGAITRRPPFLLAFLQLGDRLRESGALEEAVAVLETGLTLLPDAHALRLALGHVHLKRGDRPLARALFAPVLAAAPQSHNALTAMAGLLALEADHGAAVDHYRRALLARPDDAMTRIALARSLLEIGDRAAGEAALRAAARGDPQLGRLAMTALAAASHGRFFLRPSAAASFFDAK
jgi:tetratricopeptide (TPR) repeat protein